MRAKATLAAALATVVIVVTWRLLFVTWAPPTTFQFDIAERVLHPWWALSWIAVGVLAGAMLTGGRLLWIPLVSIGLVAVALQTLLGVAFAFERPLDGSMSLTGAVLASVSVVQLAVSLAWIGLIVSRKRTTA